MDISLSTRSSTLLNAQAGSLPTMLRASPQNYNKEDEIDRFAQVIASL